MPQLTLAELTALVLLLEEMLRTVAVLMALAKHDKTAAELLLSPIAPSVIRRQPTRTPPPVA